MAKSSKISPELVRQLIDYDPVTGMATWRPREARFFKGDRRCPQRLADAWNGRYAGKPCFTVFAKRDYTSKCAIFKVSYPASHIAWIHTHGKAPDHVIDHINGDRSDNRMANLRDVPQAINARNCRLRSDSSSGFAGIYQDRKTQHWHTRIYFEGHVITLGSYVDLQHAKVARRTAEILLGFTERHGIAAPFLKRAEPG